MIKLFLVLSSFKQIKLHVNVFSNCITKHLIEILTEVSSYLLDIIAMNMHEKDESNHLFVSFKNN